MQNRQRNLKKVLRKSKAYALIAQLRGLKSLFFCAKSKKVYDFFIFGPQNAKKGLTIYQVYRLDSKHGVKSRGKNLF